MDGERPEWLPADWKVCVRVRSSGKKDKYYVDPSNELRFNSKPEVLRHLKNGEKDLKVRELNKVDMKKSVTERLPSGWIKDVRTTQKGGKTRRDAFYIDPVSGRRFCSMQEVERYLETINSRKEECSEDDPIDKRSSGNESVKSEGAAAESINPPEADASAQIEKKNGSMAEDEEKPSFRKKRKKNSKWMNGLPRRTSKRLARVEADPPLEVDSIGKSKLSGKTEVKSSENVDKQKETSTNLPVADLSSAEEPKIECDEEKLKSSGNDIFMDPCIEFAIKTLTGTISLEDVNKMHEASPIQAPSSVLPFSDIWTDPCFEFAVKMLTSEIPVEDGSHLQIAFQQPLSSSGTSRCNSITK